MMNGKVTQIVSHGRDLYTLTDLGILSFLTLLMLYFMALNSSAPIEGYDE